MAIEQLQSAQLAENVQQEFDPLSPKSIRLWRKLENPVDENDWEHIVSLDPKTQEQNGMHSVPVTISKWKTRDNSFLARAKRLFHRSSEYDPQVGKVLGGPEVEQALLKRRRALMVWAKDAGVPLDEKAMMELVPPPREQSSGATVESIESLGANVRLLNVKAEVMDKIQKNALNTHSKELTSIS